MMGNWRRKPDKGSIDKNKPLNSDTELKKKIDDCWRSNTERKVINEKVPDLRGVLGEKTIPYD